MHHLTTMHRWTDRQTADSISVPCQ